MNSAFEEYAIFIYIYNDHKLIIQNNKKKRTILSQAYGCTSCYKQVLNAKLSHICIEIKHLCLYTYVCSSVVY